MSIRHKILVLSIRSNLGSLIKAKLPNENINVLCPDHLPDGNAGVDDIVKNNLSLIKETEVLLAEQGTLIKISHLLPNLKWFQSTWAGVEGIITHFTDKELPPYAITRMSNQSFCQLMSEYVIGQIIQRERDWGVTQANQKKRVWSLENKVLFYRSLRDLTVTVMGVGEVGTEVCRVLKALRCRVIGYSRTPRDTLSEVMDEHFHGKDLGSALSQSDYFVNCLPNTPETTGLLSLQTLRAAKDESVLINIGRGNVARECDIITCLNEGPLSAAILDVFDKEPLDASSELWTHPKVTITPHCAGISRAGDVADMFVENFTLYNKGEPLKCLLDIRRGY